MSVSCHKFHEILMRLLPTGSNIHFQQNTYEKSIGHLHVPIWYNKIKLVMPHGTENCEETK